MAHTTLHLYKQNFKFSAAHFLIFDKKNAEKLHGHNYQVAVDLLVPTEMIDKEKGYFIDFNVFKKHIKNRLDQWDEVVLLPEKQQDMSFKDNGKSLEVIFRDRYYVFPKNEVVLLPISNTSVEQLSRLLARDFLTQFRDFGVKKVRVRVEETRGQGASTIAKAN